jgi:hypothetical protein
VWLIRVPVTLFVVSVFGVVECAGFLTRKGGNSHCYDAKYHTVTVRRIGLDGGVQTGVVK